MKLCDYGCGQIAIHQFKNGKWCCSNSINSCPSNRLKKSISLKGKYKSKIHKQKISESKKGSTPWNKGKINVYSEQSLALMSEKGKIHNKGRTPWNKGKTYEELYGKEKSIYLKQKHSLDLKGQIPWNKNTIKNIKKQYSLFSKIEPLRYNPDKPDEKEIQVHCKNHNCPNSKEQGGWFTPSYIQLYERIRQLEKDYGNGGCYLYCSDECKNECPLFNLHSDPFQSLEKQHIQSEYQTFRNFVLKRDNYECQYCGELAEHVHHERPQKLEPFFALDPDLAWSVCKKCHYKYGHKTGTECSTGNLANKTCIGKEI